MTIEINDSRIIKIQTTYNSVDELPKIERFYFSVLSKIFLGNAAILITIAPQKKYSLGYEIGPFHDLRIGKAQFLINEVNACSSSMLMEISKSEEFNRGLLILMTGKETMSLNMEEIVKYIHNKVGFESLSYEVVRCENDGKSLYIYNTELSKENLLSIASTVAFGN